MSLTVLLLRSQVLGQAVFLKVGNKVTNPVPRGEVSDFRNCL